MSFKPGDDEISQDSLVYKNSGWQGGGLVSTNVSFVSRYIKITGKPRNFAVQLGFYFSPERFIEVGKPDKCQLLEEESDKYLATGLYPLCKGWGDDEFPACTETSKNQFYFQFDFIDDQSGKKYKSGIHPSADDYFKINKLTKLPFKDTKSSTGSFDWLIEGEFSATLHAYKPGFPNENHESIQIKNARFKMGMQNLCQ